MNSELLPKVGKYKFSAFPFHCDFLHELFLGHLGNALLNAADFHSNDRGYGMTYLNPNHKTWVLSRLAIELTGVPKAYEEYYVETWVESAMKFFTSRNYTMKGPDGHVYGYGRSIWALIDTDTRQPADILSIRDGRITEYIENDKECPIKPASRVPIGEEAEYVRTIDTYYNDVDMNGHINSVKYIEHLLDLFSLDYYRHHHLRRLDIAYVAETYQGDQLHFYREEINENEYNIRIMKSSPEKENKVEVVRCYVKFVKD